MNEIIEELLSQAQVEKWGNSPYNGSPEFEGYDVDQALFAELIIKECVTNVVQPYMTRWPEDRALSIKIKEHFGIK